MTNLSIDQLTKYLNNTIVKQYFLNKFNLNPNEILDQIQTSIEKRNYFNDYYNKRKHGPKGDDAKDKIKANNKKWYDENKVRVSALQRCKYANDPEYRKWCQQYQALYAQKKRNVNRNERNVGRPRIYNFDSS